jgi:hypothetical protein
LFAEVRSFENDRLFVFDGADVPGADKLTLFVVNVTARDVATTKSTFVNKSLGDSDAMVIEGDNRCR